MGDSADWSCSAIMQHTLSRVSDAFKSGYTRCCNTCSDICNFNKEPKNLKYGRAAFVDQLLVRKDVEFVVPPQAKVVYSTSNPQGNLDGNRCPSPDWKDGLRDPQVLF